VKVLQIEPKTTSLYNVTIEEKGERILFVAEIRDEPIPCMTLPENSRKLYEILALNSDVTKSLVASLIKMKDEAA
jgi:hypothetical protein